jgi:CubicO group peptidase (beta-lactamase class C family)
MISRSVLLLLLALGTRAQVRYDATALDSLIRFNEAQKTARLMVSIEDSVIADKTFRGKPDELYRIYSITKLFSGVAVGIMMEQGLIRHPEQKISDFFPSWKSDPLKDRITIRHVLQHNSGLYSSKGSMEIYPQQDFVRFALEDSVISEPGHVFFYNNRAINLVSGLVKQVTGSTLEQYLNTHLFQPLGIQQYLWPSDPAGNTWGMDGLRLSAEDLLKVGRLLAAHGNWQGKQILSRAWCDMMFQLPLVNSMRGVGGYGLGVRVLYINGHFRLSREGITQLMGKGLDPALANRVLPLADTVYQSWAALGKALAQACTAADIEHLTAASFTHMIPVYSEVDNQVLVVHFGEIGQQVNIYPKKKMAMVRLLDERWGRKTTSDGRYAYEVNERMFPYFFNLVAAKQANSE